MQVPCKKWNDQCAVAYTGQVTFYKVPEKLFIWWGCNSGFSPLIDALNIFIFFLYKGENMSVSNTMFVTPDTYANLALGFPGMWS